MFRIKDICNIAIQIERNGEAAYRQAAETVSDPDIAELFSWMADEERRHADWFAAIELETPIPPEHAELEAMGRSLLQDMVSNETFSLDRDALTTATSLGEAARQATVFEEDTILFYEFLRGLIDDPDTGRQLARIIEEERRHAEQLTELAATHA